MKKSKAIFYVLICFTLVFFLIAGTGCKTNTTTSAAAAETTMATMVTDATTGAATTAADTNVATTVSGSTGATVSIKSNAFNPDTLTIKVGDTVTWINNDSYAHTVTSDNGAFDSGSISGGGTFSFTFKTAGTYNYICSIHTFMTAKIVVQ